MGEVFERTMPAIPLSSTGERLTTASGKQVEVEHLHRYLLARTLCRELDVLDVASGEGYGSAFLAQTARSVIGIEIDPAAIKHAQNSYTAPNLRFLEGDVRSLPLPDACVDVVVSFETIEHFYEHDVFVAEVRRVLRPGGRFVVSSPDRDVYSPPGLPPNPYHVRELTRSEFSSLLYATFQHVILLGQRPVLGSVLVAEPSIPGAIPNSTLTFERRGPDSFEASDGLPCAVYLLAVASDAPIEFVPNSIYIDNNTIEGVGSEAEQYVRHLEAELAKRDRDLGELVASATQAKLEGLAALAQKKAELNSVLRSSSWRLTQPFRSLVEHHPQARRTLRRITKLVWWTVTFQLPARIVTRFRSPLPPLLPVRPTVVDNARAPTEFAAKAVFTELAQAELFEFLASDERLSFPETQMPDISVVVVLWNQAHLTLRCLRALLAQIGPSIEVVLVDNASSDETSSLLSRLDGVRVLTSKTNEGFLLGCNRGASASRGRAILLLNSDAFVRQGALAAALKTLDSNQEVGAVGGRLVLPSGRLQEAGSIIWSDASTAGYGRGLPEQAGVAMFRREVDYCSGAFLLTPSVIWNRLGRPRRRLYARILLRSSTTVCACARRAIVSFMNQPP